MPVKIVKIIDHKICLPCRHAAMVETVLADGSVRRMLHCKRLDCDNWQVIEGLEAVKSFKIVQENTPS